MWMGLSMQELIIYGSSSQLKNDLSQDQAANFESPCSWWWCVSIFVAVSLQSLRFHSKKYHRISRIFICCYINFMSLFTKP